MHAEHTPKRVVYLAIALLLFLVPAGKAATVDFAGRTWKVSDRYGAPGPNWFSNACVWVDGNGWLHLQVKKFGTTWHSAEVQTTNTLGYGEYRWYVGSRVDDMDTNVVAGLFTYEYLPGDENEVDIEFTKAFTDDPATNLHYTIQPYYAAGHQYQKAMSLTNVDTTHRFIWNPGYIRWESWYGHSASPPDTNNLLGSWTYTSNDVPVHSNEHCYINLWMFLGELPVETASNKLEMIIKDFVFTPSTNTLLYDEFSDTSMSNIWATFGETTGGRLAETNDTLRVNPVNEDWTALGYRTTNQLSWADNGLQYVFSACLKTVDVSTASTNGPIDLYSLQTFFNSLSAGIYDSYWCSNAVSFKGGYDSANDSLRLELYTKTGWPQNWGNLRFSGTITNISAYANTNGLELQFVLESTNYQVRAYYLTNAVAIATNSGTGVGPHNLGSALYSGYYAVGAQNERDGRGVLYWNRTRVFTDTGSYTTAPPPAVTNPPNVVAVGTNTTTWRYPLDTKYKKSRLQVLYLADQMVQSGNITQMDIYVAGKPRIPLSNFTVRLKHTSVTVQSNRWADAAGWTTGFQATVTINSEGWYPIPLSSPFAYDGASNLLVDFSINNTRTKYPHAYARYSATAVNQCLARSNGSGDPLTWTGTDPAGPDEEVLTNAVINARFYFEGAPAPEPFGLRDEFNDNAKDTQWDYLAYSGGAIIEETNGYLRVRGNSGTNWDTSGYITAAPVSWNDAGAWYVFSAVLRTAVVEYARSGEDVRAVLGFSSEKDNAWFVTNSMMLHARYDADSNSLNLVFFTKTSAPLGDGIERFNGTISNASWYFGSTTGIAFRILLGNHQYALRFCDGLGLPIPVQTNSGACSGNHNLGSALYSAYALVAIQNVVSNHGSVCWDWTTLATSTVPSIALFWAGQTSTNGEGLITISNAFYDAEGDYGRIRVEASTNGGASWFGPWIGSVSGTYAASVAASQGSFQVLRVATTNGSGPATNRLAITWDTKHPGNAVNLSGLVCTNIRVRLMPDDHNLQGTTVTGAVFSVDNAAPSAGGASVSVEGGAAYTLDSTLNSTWSGFTDSGSSIAGYYLSLTNNGGTASGNWTNASPGRIAGAPDATNTVYVWGRDACGNIGTAVSDSILLLSPGGDWDSDGLTNGAEGSYSCSPLDPDSEDDGMPDGWEVQYGLNPTNGMDAGGQDDSDRYSNLDEYYWGTDPKSGSSLLQFDGHHSGGPTNAVLNWNSITGRLYSLYLAAGGYSNGMPWSPMAAFSNVAGAQGTMIYTDQNVGAAGRYYKLRIRLP